MKQYIIILIGLLSIATMASAQKEMSDIWRGNKQYRDSAYTQAEINYRKGLEKNANSFEGHYNLGNSLFKQEKYPEAAQEYAKAVEQVKVTDGKVADKDKKRLSNALHNIGNAFYAQQDYQKAITAYQQSLMLDPKDDETRYNLIKAMQMLQQQQQQQQNENQDQNENQEQQEQEQQQQQEQQEQDQQEQDPPQQPEDNQMDKEQAEQILQALEQDEQETQEKAKRQQMQSKFRTDKDW